MGSVDINFRPHARRYVAQVLLATVTLFLVLWVEQLVVGTEVAGAFLIGAIASTAFILFISPHRPAAMPRRVLGGHGWAIVVAIVASLLAEKVFGDDWAATLPVMFSLQVALTVGAAMLAMAATNTEHAPAVGTAMAILGNGLDWSLIVFVSTSILMLVGVHCLVRKYLIDLYS